MVLIDVLRDLIGHVRYGIAESDIRHSSWKRLARTTRGLVEASGQGEVDDIVLLFH